MPDPNLSSFIWSVADLLRGDYKQSEYGKVILPFTVLRRLDCVLEPTKTAVLAEKEKREKAKLNPEPFLLKKSGQLFYNISPLDLKKLMGDQDNIAENLRAYMQAFSPAVRDIFERFEFHTQIDRLQKAKLLYLVAEKFANIDLHPNAISNAQMGAVFEELIRKFAEISNETAGEHFTPREVIRLMVNLLFIEDDEALAKPGVVRSIYDPTAGTGGMLSVAGEHLAEINPNARLVMYGQELNPESYAICKADMLIKGQDIANIIFGNTLSDDGLPGKHFDYMLSNPPFGVEWKKIEKEIRKEAGYVNGYAQHALFNQPSGVAIDAMGTLFISDSANHCIRRCRSSEEEWRYDWTYVKLPYEPNLSQKGMHPMGWIPDEMPPEKFTNRPFYEGPGKRKGIIALHPLAERPAQLRFNGQVPVRQPILSVQASGHFRGDSILECVVNGIKVGEYVITGTQWTNCTFDLSPFVNRTVNLELWNSPGGKSPSYNEHCYIDMIGFRTKEP